VGPLDDSHLLGMIRCMSAQQMYIPMSFYLAVCVLSATLEISWNLVDARGKFYDQQCNFFLCRPTFVHAVFCSTNSINIDYFVLALFPAYLLHHKLLSGSDGTVMSVGRSSSSHARL